MEGPTSGTSSSNAGRSNASIKLMPIENKPPPKNPTSLLDDRNSADADELYSANERALSEFLKLHPMLSLEATSAKTLTSISKLMTCITDIQVKEPELVSKAHDDQFLARADPDLGERPCVLGDKCICRWMSIFRYGEDTEKAFVCKEWLLPSQLKKFREDGQLPQTHQKCLLCTRYFASYTYHLARSSPTFRATSPMQLTLFANQAHECTPSQEIPSIANQAGEVDGYRPDTLLYVDEAFIDTPAARDGLSHLVFQPIVRFCCNDYVFVRNETTGQWMLNQCKLGNSHFGQPARSRP